MFLFLLTRPTGLLTWPDRLDPFVDTEIYMVDPDLTDEVEHVAGHLILVQRSRADCRSSRFGMVIRADGHCVHPWIPLDQSWSH